MNLKKGILKTLYAAYMLFLIVWAVVFAFSCGGLLPLLFALFDEGFNLYVVAFYVISWLLIIVYNSIDGSKIDKWLERYGQ